MCSHGRVSYTCFDAIFEPKNMTMEEPEDTILEIYEAAYSDAVQRERALESNADK